jgi:cytochrome c oxidase assembly protein subunit 15
MRRSGAFKGISLKEQSGIAADPRPSRGLHIFAIFVAALTVVLLLAGALVTSNEAGDSVPDWPLSFGRWLISSEYFKANVRFEYSHRFIAGMVGFATFALAAWTYFGDQRRWMRRLALIALAGVVMQAVIGGVRVHYPAYKPLIAVPHALIAQSFFAVIVSLAVFTSRDWWAERAVKSDTGGTPLKRLTAISVAAVLGQLVLGAGFRHQAFGILPHVLGAIVVTGLVGWTAMTTLRRHRKDSYLGRPAKLLFALLAAQLSLGVLAYIARMSAAGRRFTGVSEFFASMSLTPLASATEVQPVEPMISLTAGHVVVGALTLATIIVLMLRSYRVLAPARERAAETRGQKPRLNSLEAVSDRQP